MTIHSSLADLRRDDQVIVVDFHPATKTYESIEWTVMSCEDGTFMAFEGFDTPDEDDDEAAAFDCSTGEEITDRSTANMYRVAFTSEVTAGAALRGWSISR